MTLQDYTTEQLKVELELRNELIKTEKSNRKMKTIKIILCFMLAIAYISLTVAGFMDGLKVGLVKMGTNAIIVCMFALLAFCVFEFSKSCRR